MNRIKKIIDEATEEELIAIENYIKIRKEVEEYRIIEIEIPYKFPSLNEYTNECRKNPFAGANMKKKVQSDICLFINRLPKFTKPVTIDFTWYEGNGRRDIDNVAFAKKFILDALVQQGKLKDDNRKCVTAFRDKVIFTDKNEWKVVLVIREEGEVKSV